MKILPFRLLDITEKTKEYMMVQEMEKKEDTAGGQFIGSKNDPGTSTRPILATPLKTD